MVFSDGEAALTVTITGRAITAFVYRCQAYAITEENSALLPAAMAMAIASLHPGCSLSLAYVDGGAGTLSAFWLET